MEKIIKISKKAPAGFWPFYGFLVWQALLGLFMDGNKIYFVFPFLLELTSLVRLGPMNTISIIENIGRL